MKGILLAGGLGVRLYPSTKVLSKQLIPVYDKPMVYYSLSILMLADITEILVITTAEHYYLYKSLLGDGSQLGLKLQYLQQEKPRGLAEAFILGEKFIGKSDVCLTLGDNILHGNGLSNLLAKSKKIVSKNKKAMIFGYEVEKPENYGVAFLDDNDNLLDIIEKPKNPKSNVAVIGIYMYPNNVIQLAKNIKPSKRGELEITSINNLYLKSKKINIEIFGRGFTWFDTGTYESILEASNLIKLIEKRSGSKISCLEEIAFNKKFIDKKALDEIIDNLRDCSYKEYLKKIY